MSMLVHPIVLTVDFDIKNVILDILSHEGTKVEIIYTQTNNFTLIIKVTFTPNKSLCRLDPISRETTPITELIIKHTFVLDITTFDNEVNIHKKVGSVLHVNRTRDMKPICPLFCYSEYVREPAKSVFYGTLYAAYERSTIKENIDAFYETYREKYSGPRTEQFIVMEMMEGYTLFGFLRERRLSLDHILYGSHIKFTDYSQMKKFYGYLVSILLAKKNIHHGDLTTGNIYITFKEIDGGMLNIYPRVFDFGRSIMFDKLDVFEPSIKETTNSINILWREIYTQAYTAGEQGNIALTDFIETKVKEGRHVEAVLSLCTYHDNTLLPENIFNRSMFDYVLEDATKYLLKDSPDKDPAKFEDEGYNYLFNLTEADIDEYNKLITSALAARESVYSRSSTLQVGVGGLRITKSYMNKLYIRQDSHTRKGRKGRKGRKTRKTRKTRKINKN